MIQVAPAITRLVEQSLELELITKTQSEQDRRVFTIERRCRWRLIGRGGVVVDQLGEGHTVCCNVRRRSARTRASSGSMVQYNDDSKASSAMFFMLEVMADLELI